MFIISQRAQLIAFPLAVHSSSWGVAGMFVQQSPFFLLSVNMPWKSGVFFRKLVPLANQAVLKWIKCTQLSPLLTSGVDDTKSN